ncbi:MAG TPA: FG-GAP-like repeat-containing protein [Terriglobales bacterium]|nr:FG-GAP-like repeat-containing protein [Terriglobales bacterium]
MPQTSLPSNILQTLTMRVRRAGTAAIMLTLLLACAAQMKAQTYTPIIFPGSIETIARGNNALGQIVGEYQDSGGVQHGFIYSAGTYTSFDYPGASTTALYGINNAGDMVGFHDFLVPFFYKGGTFTTTAGVGSDVNNFDFIPVGSGGFLQTPTSQPTAITFPGSSSKSTLSNGFSDAFQIVGRFADQGGVIHGFSYNFSSYTMIDVPGFSTGWNSVNTVGDMVGGGIDSTMLVHAILRSGGVFTQIDDNPSRINHNNQANHINDFGQIVGETPGTVGQPGQIGFLRNPAARNAVPFINHPLVPNTAVPGSGGFTLTVEGTGFVSGAAVNWNGSHRTTAFQNSEKLTATISAADVATAGTAVVTVVNPAPGGGSSNTRFFQITSPIGTPAFDVSTVTAGSSPQRNIAADFNRDGIMDLAAVDGANNQVLVMLGNGGGTFQSPVTYGVGKNPSTLIAGDFDKDGKLDIAVGDSDGGIYVLQGNGNGTFHVDSIISVAGAGPWDLAVGDFNGDGRLDLACVNQTDNTISIFLGNGDATFNGEGFFQPPATLSTNAAPAQITVGDFNGDGILDLAVANFGSFTGDTVSVFLGNGNGTFKPKVDYDVSLAPLSIVAADFNGDGKLDLAVANSCGSSTPCGRPGSVSILLGNGDGTFEHHTDYPAGSFPYTIVAGDFNGDGKLDVAVSDLDSSQVTILAGVGDGTLQSLTTLGASSSPVGLLAADFNGDGKMDLAAGTHDGVDIMLQTSSVTTTVTLSHTALSFANVPISTISAPKTLTLTNTGTAVLTISSISPSSNFEVSSTTCGGTLAARAHCTVSVTFQPPALGSFTGTLTFVDSAANSPQTVSLTGTGTVQVTLTPVTLAFAIQPVFSTSPAKIVTLTNHMPTPLSFRGINFAGANPGDFTETDTCGSSVAGSGHCTISVTFNPQAIGARTATMIVNEVAANSPQIIPLKGTGEVQVKLTPTTMAFAAQTVGTRSAAKVATFTNNLSTALNFSGASFTGTNPGEFAQTNTCGSSVPAKGKCTISVTFTPQAKGARTATLNLSDGANTSPQTIPLKGTGR